MKRISCLAASLLACFGVAAASEDGAIAPQDFIDEVNGKALANLIGDDIYAVELYDPDGKTVIFQTNEQKALGLCSYGFLSVKDETLCFEYDDIANPQRDDGLFCWHVRAEDDAYFLQDADEPEFPEIELTEVDAEEIRCSQI